MCAYICYQLSKRNQSIIEIKQRSTGKAKLVY